MTSEEVLEYNKRCAKFLEWKKCLTHEFDKYGYCETVDGFITPFDNRVADPQILEYNSSIYEYAIKDLQFTISWDWVMEVIEKIKETITEWDHIYTMSPEEQKVDYQLFKEDSIANRIEHLTMYADKEAVIEAINQFLIWHKRNKL